MKHSYYESMQNKLKHNYNLDVIYDVILSRSNHITCFMDLNTKTEALEVVTGSLSVIGFPDQPILRFNELWQVFDKDNTYAKVSGRSEYFNYIKDKIMAFNNKSSATFPINHGNHRYWIHLQIVPIENESGLYSVFITDVSSLLTDEEALYYKTHHDSLTGLFNKYTLDYHYGERYLFEDFHVLFLDIDNFKALNDQSNHKVGDQYLADFAKILKQYENEYSVFYRIGGDEFVGLFFETTNKVLDVADNILHQTRELSQHYATSNTSVSIGIVKANQRDDVIKKADTLMYKAKTLGKNQKVFEEEKNMSHVSNQT